MTLTHRIATLEDAPDIEALMAISMAKLLPNFLDPDQVARSSNSMGIDTLLIEDGTYFLIFEGDTLVGCGGWSRRRTLFGGNQTEGRDDALADPSCEPAKIRAMYTHPEFTRRGIGSLLISLGEDAAMAEGFTAMELGSTAPGLPLYERCGYVAIEDVSTRYDDGVVVPTIRMRKELRSR
ncbi:MAG: GNAT family N-acetyltransferase [Henriciella sp.]|nr:GNAT family N-acetyltransferase [Henriciella sp.]